MPRNHPNLFESLLPTFVVYVQIFSDLQTSFHQTSPDIFAISESLLNSDVADDDFQFPGYQPLTREDDHGLMIYFKSSLPVSRQPNLEQSDQPFMCFRLSLLHSTSYLFFLYRSPSNQDCSVLEAISSSIDRAFSQHPTANIFVCGDFNVHHKDWLPNHNKTDEAGKSACAFSVSQGLIQMVDFITRIPDRDSDSPSTLDLFLSSHPDICKVSSSPPLGTSDHVVITAEVSLNSPSSRKSPIHRTLYSFERGDWDSFRNFLQDVPWNDVFKLKAEKCAVGNHSMGQSWN